MTLVFLESALRSLLAGLAVAMGLRLFRVRNVLAQKAAWGLVLVSALAMPLLLPITAKWHLAPAAVNLVLPAHPMTLLEELQARIVAQGGAGSKFKPPAVSVPQNDSTKTGESATPKPAGSTGASQLPSRHAQRAAERGEAARVRPESSTQPIASRATSVQTAASSAPIRNVSISPKAVALTLYCGVAALFLLRLALGLFRTIRVWQAALPVPAGELGRDAASLPLRASSQIASPVTIGSAVLLPADYRTWDREKLRIVLAHERSHIRQGDFYLQVLASFYAALVWFSPLGWWLKQELAELAEAISDRAGMKEATSRTSYAQILLEFAAAPRKTQIGVAMARPGSLSRRIERLLNDHSFRQCFAGGGRALIAVVLVPAALLASTMLVRVQAATGAKAAAPAPAAAFTPPKSPAAEPAAEMVAAVPSVPAIGMAPAMATATGVMQAGVSLSFDRTLTVSGTAQLAASTGSGDIHITRGSSNQIRIHGRIHVSREGSEDQARQIAANPPIEQDGDVIRVGQHQEQWHGISIDYEIEAPAATVLDAISGSGDIVDDGVGQNAKLQTGSGDIKATSLEGPFTVKTGSGNITAAQTGQGDVVAETGSGDIELKDVHGGFRGQTGSGDIKASGTPSASWILQTGSGAVELWIGNAPLTLDASTGSGSVTTEHEMLVQGTFDHHHIHGNLNGGGPTVRVQTGSGDIRIH